MYKQFNEESLIGKYVTIMFADKIKNSDGNWSLRFPVLKFVYDQKREV